MKNMKNILWGLLLIVLGVLIGLDTFEVVDINFFFDGWWTLFIIIPCTIDLFRGRDKTFDLLGIAVGIFLLLACQELITFEMLMKLMLPTILVVVGVSLLFKDSLFGGNVAKKIKALNQGKISGREYTATFSTQHVNSVDGEILESMDMTAVFGSVKCNFENAVVNHDIVINTNATFGSVEIIAPKGVQIVTKSTSVFGGVSDKTETVQQDVGLPRIYINATCLFGGVDVL